MVARIRPPIGTAPDPHRSGAVSRARVLDAQFLEGYHLARATGDPYREGHALIALAKVQLRAGRLDDAMSYAERALAIHRDVGDRYGQARALEQLGRNLADLGHRARAVVCLREAVAIFTQLGAVEAAGLRMYLAALGPAVIRPDW